MRGRVFEDDLPKLTFSAEAFDPFYRTIRDLCANGARRGARDPGYFVQLRFRSASESLDCFLVALDKDLLTVRVDDRAETIKYRLDKIERIHLY